MTNYINLTMMSSIENGNQSYSRKCQVSGCGANSSAVVVYSAKKSKDRERFQRWLFVLKLSDCKSCVNACQRHFPAGAPTKNNPDPNPKLFNPIPKNGSCLASETNHISVLNNRQDEKILGADGKPLPSAVYPPPGSVVKIAPNATLIDLKKIKEKQDLKKPIRIEEVTVMIDEKDYVKVVDYGPKDMLNKSSEFRLRREGRQKRRSVIPSSWDDGGNLEDFVDLSDEVSFEQFAADHATATLGNVLEQMRQLRIDCNTAIVDAFKRKIVYAHRAVLVARSPYFYRQMYLKRKKNKYLYEFCKFTLPIDADFEAVEAVVSYIYTGSLHVLYGKKSSSVKELLSLFEMKDTMRQYELEMLNREEEQHIRGKKRIKQEPEEESESVLVLPFIDENVLEEKIPIIEVGEEKMELDRKKKKKGTEIECGEDYHGKLKVSVQKIVENALNPFLGKIEELFDPSATTLHIAKTSQHIITLWHADILLTKLFDQNELTKFFSEVMNEVLEKNIVQLRVQSIDTAEPGAYTVETLYTQTGNPVIDDSYTKPSLGVTIEEPVETVTVGNMHIINYQQMDPKHIPKYVHMIAMYRFNIFMTKKRVKMENNEADKDTLMPPIMEGDELHDDSNSAVNVIDDFFVNRISQEEELLSSSSTPALTRACFQQVNIDLKRRVVADLELYVNPSFHEELIMHIIVDQMDDKTILPLSMAIFLAKGCNFCRKKECKTEDLTVPVSPDNPVCPDRQCIKRNLQCDICNKQMSTSKSLARHKYGVHDIEMGETSGIFICSHCGETFSKKWKLNIHEREHEDRKVEHVCRYCKKKICGTIALKKHISMVHEAKPQYSCDFCQKVFKRRETLSVHTRIHTGEKPFRCTHCEYASETKGNLKAHFLRKHKLQIVSINSHDGQDQIIADETHVIDDHSHVINEQSSQHPTTEDQVMAATIVAHSLTVGSFIITSETSPTPIIP